ncbi:type II secretion system F family protein [Nitrincola tapanii]|nr:type II secretion system F family protein [Nitrincola tapanii]
MMQIWLLSALLLALIATYMLRASWRELRIERQVLNHLGISQELDERGLRSLKQVRFTKKSGLLLDAETQQMLARFGWRRPYQRSLFVVIQLATPILAALLAALYYSLSDSNLSIWIWILFAAGIAYLFPKRILKILVESRLKRIRIEVSIMISLLRILFEVGMTVEQALRVLADEGQEIMPEIASELNLLLQRVDAGLDLAEELYHAAAVLEVEDLTDTFGILSQLIRQGGGAMHSLLALKELLDDKRMTALQEQVSKLSAKMSAVMVGFLFPALLIVLAGPGFIAIIRALGEMK